MSMNIEAKREMKPLINLSIGSSQFKLSTEEAIEAIRVLLEVMADDCLYESTRTKLAKIATEGLSNESLADALACRLPDIKELGRIFTSMVRYQMKSQGKDILCNDIDVDITIKKFDERKKAADEFTR